MSHVWINSSLLEVGPSSAVEERVKGCVYARSLYVFLERQYLCLCGAEHMIVGLCQWV